MFNSGWSNQNVKGDAGFFGFFIQIGILVFVGYLGWIKIIQPFFDWVKSFF